jgi:hypothetical protein
MKPVLAALFLAAVAGTAAAQPAPPAPPPDCCEQQGQQGQPQAAPAPGPAPQVAMAPQPQPQLQPQPQPDYAVTTQPTEDDGGWKRPVGRRFAHGFRLGWTYLYNMDKPTRMDDAGNPISLGMKYELKSPNMMLLGYEGFYRIVGHSWLNVLMVGNVTVAGLEQSKFIPAASGLLGFEFDRSFQLGVGVNLTPDPDAVSHMIAAAGWTPHVGSIQTPVHFFFVPDTEGNHRMGATIGMTW